jgi:cytochrome c6
LRDERNRTVFVQLVLNADEEEKMKKTMKWITTIASGVALAGLALSSAPAGADNTAEATYKAKCVSCHGADGKGETPAGKATKARDFGSEDVQKTSDADLNDVIAKGKAKMPAFKTLTADQVKDLVAYTRALGQKK